MDHFCTLCGVTIKRVPRHLRPGQVLDWRCEIRGVERDHGHDSTRITGVGYLEDGYLKAPRGPTHSYLESLDDLENYNIDYGQEAWTFVFHNACWELFLIQLGKSSSLDLNHVTHHFFNLLHCHPADRRSAVFTAHDFGGAFQFWSHPADIRSGWRFLWAEPKVPCFAPSRPVHRPAPDDHLPVSFHSLSVKPLDDCFKRLPSEVIFFILNSLPSPDICSSRLSSRTLAALTTPGRLPQSFWRSRFSEDRELGFLCATPQSISLSGRVDWGELYRVVKAELKDKSASGHLRNTDRVWRSLRHLTDCLVLLLDQNLSLLPPDALNPHLMAQGWVAGHVVRGRARLDSEAVGGQYGRGSRLLGAGFIFFDFTSPKATAFTIKVSLIAFNCTAYVCGLRCVRHDGSRCGVEISRVGLIVPSSETALEVNSGDDLRGIRVATTVQGVIGIAFIIYRAEAERVLSAGLVHNLPQSAGVATLRPQLGRKLEGVAIGFDACKFVSVQLVERWPEAKQNAKSLPEEQSSDLQLIPVHLHNPAESPEIDTMLAHLETIGPVQLSLFVSMNFGGSDGARLSSLSRIVAYHDDLGDCIRGFAFHFVDGTREKYGTTDIMDSAARRWTCVEETVAIDGPGGERIIRLEYGLKNKGLNSYAKCVKMVTNWGRNMTLSPSSCSGKAITWVRAQNLNAPTTITGIIMRTQLSTGDLQTLATCGVGVTKQEEEEPPQQDTKHRTFQVDRDCIDKSPRTFSVKCYTTAILADIKRVSISCGMSDKTRSKSHVSGLRLDYFSSANPVYVGQWFNEIDSLEFEPGDRILGLTFWQTQESPPNAAGMQRENTGRIAGVRIVTAGSEAKQLEVCLRDKDDLLEYSFYENMFEDLYGLVWAFNHELDYIQTVTRPPASKHGSTLILHSVVDMWPWPNRRFPGKLLWEVMGDDGVPVHVTEIHVIFQETSLVGFVFDYGGVKTRRSAGCTSGERHTMVLKEGEIPSRMDTLTWGSDHAVIFYTNHGQTRAFASTESSMSPLERPAEDFDLYMLNGSDDGSHPSPGHEDDLDELKEGGICVGIWVTMRIHPTTDKDVEAVGAILVETTT